MNCAKSIRLLSDFHDGSLNVIETAKVWMHLMACLSCREIFRDLDLIVTAAAELRDKDCVTYPNEKVSWRRLELAALNSTDFAGGQQWLRR